MAIMKSGASNTYWTIDPLSNAGRQTRYGVDGELLDHPSGSARGIASLQVTQSAATAQGATVWSIRNLNASKILYITRGWLQFYFTGTGAASEMVYALRRGITCTAVTNGSYVVPARKRTALNNSDVEVKTLDTGLTLTGVSWDAYSLRFVWSRLTHSGTQAGGVSAVMPFDFGNYPFELAQNEVLSIYTLANSVIGDSVTGGFEFIS